MLQDAVVGYCKVLSWNSPAGTEEKRQNTSVKIVATPEEIEPSTSRIEGRSVTASANLLGSMVQDTGSRFLRTFGTYLLNYMG
jgi:hypothetical protein